VRFLWRIDEVFNSTTHETQDLDIQIENRSKRQGQYMTLLVLLTIIFALFSMGFGSSKSLNFWKIIRIVLGLDEPTDIQRSILLNIRLPRVLMAIFAGAALATAGTLMQGSLGNPLVSPLTLGVASGASLGAALAIILGFSVIDIGFGENYWLSDWFPNTILVLNTFIFSLIVVFIVIKLGELRGVSAESYILVGIAITFINGAIVESLVYFATPQQLAQLTHWSFGSVRRPALETVLFVGVILTLIYPRLIKYSWDLNTLAIGGDDFAISTGVDPSKLRKKILVISAFATSIIIAFTGLIGFVGLAAPHIARLIIGNDYRKLVPSSALIGALLVLIADTVGGTLFSPVVLPVGIMLSILGGPFFLYLLLNRRSDVHG
jgi:iron complex transport system permease protein